MNDNQKQLEAAYKTIIETVEKQEDGKLRDGLIDTPKRASLAISFFTQGYNQKLEDVVGKAIFDTEGYDNMIIVKDIEIYSLCEHHLVPFFGKCHIGYLPNGKVLGLSKLARIAEMFSRRLQIQERLTGEIAQAISDVIKPVGVGVVIEATHMCMVMRGAQKTTTSTVTSAMLGAFRDDHRTRAEFMQLIEKK